MEKNADSRPVLVIGASGKTGSRVVAGLEERGVAVEQVSRSAGRRFDWADSTTWPTALAGVRAAYVTYAPESPGSLRSLRARFRCRSSMPTTSPR